MSDSIRTLAHRLVGRLLAVGNAAALCLLVSILVVAASACSDAPSEADCRKLLDHYVDIEANTAGVGGLSGELAAEADAVKKRVVDNIREDFMQSCLKNLSTSQLACGLKAKNADQLAGCDEG